MAESQKVTVDVEGRHLTLSNLHKVLYPEAGFAKGEVIDYYTRIAPVLLPHLADRPLTVKRYPNGVEAQFFYEKNATRGTPDWVRTKTIPVPGSTKRCPISSGWPTWPPSSCTCRSGSSRDAPATRVPT